VHDADGDLVQTAADGSGRPPQHILCVIGRQPVLVHHDASRETDSAAAHCLHCEVRSAIFRSGHSGQQPFVIYQRDQVPDHQVRDHSVAVCGLPAGPPVRDYPRISGVAELRDHPERGAEHMLRARGQSYDCARFGRGAGRTHDPAGRFCLIRQLDLASVGELRYARAGQAGERHDGIVGPAKSAQRAGQGGPAWLGHLGPVPEKGTEVSRNYGWRGGSGSLALGHVILRQKR
jgi:hypothetical protein